MPGQFSRLTLLATVLVLLAGAVVAADITIVVQKGRAFSTPSVQILRGGVVRFSNEDRFRHQLYVDSPGMSFDSDEHDPGTTLDIPFSKAGTFEVRCHIHPKMLMTVEVR
jgi:plastocyanin